ncbi:MAG: tetratricopeptide repeat protein [Pirellulales bacterium]
MLRFVAQLVAFLTVALLAAVPAKARAGEATFVFPGQAATVGLNDSSASAAAEAALLDDAADGRLDRLPLLEAACTAGGITELSVVETYRRRFEHWVAELQVSGHVVGGERDKARAILEYLHHRVLTGGFVETSTTLDKPLEVGTFNCISSVILFRCLAERFGLSAYGVETPGHAYAMVKTSGGLIVVQTTCRDWFAAAGDLETERSLLRQTIGATAADASAKAATPRRLSDVGLLAVVYFNRGVDLLEAGRHDAALAANQTALRLDAANTAARANLLATVNNWSLDLSRGGDFAKALRLLETGLEYAPEYELFHENLVALHQQRISRAVTVEEARPEVQSLRTCYARWSRTLAARGDESAAATIERRAAGDPFLQAR